jgi:hypothetical protein
MDRQAEVATCSLIKRRVVYERVGENEMNRSVRIRTGTEALAE